jgi:ATP-dependent DNA helicase RecQ
VPTGLDAVRIAAATRWCRGEVNELPVRKRWPTGVDEYKGSITSAMQPGRALAYANDAIWGSLIRATLAGTTTPDEEAVSALVVALTDVLKQWSRSWQRPVAVTWLPDEHAALTSELARRLAEIAGIPAVESLTWDGTVLTGGRDASSKEHVQAVRAALGTTGLALPHGPVLLVCATWRTGWRATVAAQVLADQGVEAILPIVVWQQP